MAIKDLFWACPLCRSPAAIRKSNGGERCTSCGADFRRGKGARIVATTATQRIDHPAAAWLTRLPAANGQRPRPGPERARIRTALRTLPLRRGSQLLGWIEEFSRPEQGTITLQDDRLLFRGTARSLEWPLASITAVQPSSSALQIKARDQAVAAIRFLDGSVRLWEEAIQDAIRELWRRSGRGEISEFQPCIRPR